MMKNFKVFTVVEGILIFMLLSLTNLHAANLTWSDTDFTFSASVKGDSLRLLNYLGDGDSQTWTSLKATPDSISEAASVQVSPRSANVQLSASAWGKTLTDTDRAGASASAFVSFNLENLAADEALSYNGSATTWVKRKVTVNSNGLYDLYGGFTGTIDFTNFDVGTGAYYATHGCKGTVRLDKFVVLPGSGITPLSSLYLDINDMIGGTTVREGIKMYKEDEDRNPIYYNLLVGFNTSGLAINISNLGMPFRNEGLFPEKFYELGNAGNPLVIEGWLVESSHVPVPGTLLLLFSGVTGLFGFKLSLRRRRSFNR